MPSKKEKKMFCESGQGDYRMYIIPKEKITQKGVR
jgi:hypothetical protein